MNESNIVLIRLTLKLKHISTEKKPNQTTEAKKVSINYRTGK